MSTSKASSAPLVFFGGKGGVGKTTCAAACAIEAASRGQRVLLVSTDPAHSLGDALGVKLSWRARRVAIGSGKRRRRGRAGTGALDAVELDGPRAFARWLDEHRRSLGDILEHGTWLERTDIEQLLGLSIPGVDELIALIEIGRLSEARAGYHHVIVDTAPTGHTLRLLAAPETVAAVADALDALQRPHRIVREQLARVGGPEAADRFIALVAEQARETGERLRDRRRSAFHWVLLPEELSVAESEDGLAALDRAHIPIAGVIVNRVTPDGPPCPICDRRRADERGIIRRIPARLGRRRSIRIAFAQSREPRGIGALSTLGRTLFAAGSVRRAAQLTNGSAAATSRSRERTAYSAVKPPVRSPEALRGLTDARLVLFAGKGGVGKTTCAAATALCLARSNPARRVLLLSTDPAHSLGDVLAARVGDVEQGVPDAPQNLFVRELDAPAALSARRASLEAALDEIVSGIGTAAGGRSAAELIELAPPGIDELLGMLSVAELTSPAADEQSIVVVDMAPTGHAVRLLEMPGAAREWVRVLIAVLLKYRAVVAPGSLAAELVALSKSIRVLEQLLHNRAATRVVVVTRATEVARAETERLLARLRRMNIGVAAVVVNAVTLAPGRCPRCRAIALAERAPLAAVHRACRRGRCAMIMSPLAVPPPRGVAALEAWARWVG